MTTTQEEMLEALIQARGALTLDHMVDDDGEPFGTTKVAMEAISKAISRAEAEGEAAPTMREALEAITEVSAGGPHVSAEAATKANWGALMQCRELARAALKQESQS